MYEKFEQLLQKYDVTPYRISKETGVSTATLSDWKTGKSEPKKDKIKKIADYFDLPLAYFYDDVNNIIIEKESKEEFGDRRDNRLAAYAVKTIAAHKDGNENWSEDELKKIEDYKQLLLAARKNKK